VILRRSLQFFCPSLDSELALVERTLATVHLHEASLERLLTLEDPLLETGDLSASLPELLLESLSEPNELLGRIRPGQLSARGG
jgi:hypothetical protein